MKINKHPGVLYFRFTNMEEALLFCEIYGLSTIVRQMLEVVDAIEYLPTGNTN